ncbi:MAG: ShlB/FhaC/HecB family hemolysin secretion/activation protein [Azoarcus sp.]|jgi:hemolysin activation/secretion protein|nr:ShlB/FhaC/HecB family hemolysin secretion/activation protein [Azoarcus sp.]
MNTVRGWLMLLFLLVPTWASAQFPSPVDEQQRQQERERVLREQQEQRPDVRLPRSAGGLDEEKLADETPCIVIRVITLTGESAGRFQWLLAHADRRPDGVADAAVGRCLGTRGVNLIMRRLQNALIARGFVAGRILAGPQKRLTEGLLELTVLPGRIHAIRFAPGAGNRATAWNAFPARPGELLNLRDIEQALENFKRLPTVEADIELTPAEGEDARAGESDIIVKWKQRFPFRVSVGIDDAGAKASGRYQGTLTVAYDNWWTLNDLFYASFSHDLGDSGRGSHGTRGHTVHYSVPFGYWLFSVTHSGYDTHQTVAGQSQDYVYSGETENGEIRLTRLVYRDAVRKTTVSLRGWARQSRNDIDGTEIDLQRRRMAGWGLSVAHREFIGTSTLDGSLDYRRGTGALGALKAPEEAFGEGDSRPRIFTADVQLNAPFSLGGLNLRYGGQWRAQWNRTPLVPQDRFAIGSRYTVRGFDGENLLMADHGWFVRNDLGLALGQTGQEIYLGLDYGRVDGSNSQWLIGKKLSGAVLGLRGGWAAWGLYYDAFVGRPLSKPTGFETAHTVTGFNLNWTF